MNINILKREKNSIELSIDNLTVAEILRTYLNREGIEFAAWRREHPSKPLIFKIEDSEEPVKKIVADAISMIKKDCNNILRVFKKS